MAVHNCTQRFGSKVRIWQKDFSFICAEVHIEASTALCIIVSAQLADFGTAD